MLPWRVASPSTSAALKHLHNKERADSVMLLGETSTIRSKQLCQHAGLRTLLSVAEVLGASALRPVRVSGFAEAAGKSSTL